MYRPGRTTAGNLGESQPHCLHILVEASFFNQIALTTFDIDPGRLNTRGIFQTQDKQLQTMAQLLHMELHQQGGNGPLYVESLGTALTVRLLHTFSNVEKQPRFISATLDPTSLRQVQDLILANLEHGVSLQEMADLVHLSRYHFSRLFKASVGVTPSQYLLQARLEEAKRLLLQTTAKISVVAARTGFADQAYLTRRFKARFGLTPARFRARYTR